MIHCNVTCEIVNRENRVRSVLAMESLLMEGHNFNISGKYVASLVELVRMSVSKRNDLTKEKKFLPPILNVAITKYAY